MRDVMQLGAWLLPASRAKNRVLRALKHDVDPSARVRPTVMWRVSKVSLGAGSRVGLLNVFKNLRSVQVEVDGRIGRLNVISSHPVFTRLYSDGGSLRIGRSGKITSRHQLDCSGSLSIGAYASVAGQETRVLSHSVDLSRDAQAAYPVVIGEHSFVGARCLLLGGAQLPTRSVLAAGAVLIKGDAGQEPGLYGGVPATRKTDVSGAWFGRESATTSDVYVPETGTTIKGAI